MTGWRDVLSRGLTFALLGALATVAIAWVTAWWQPEGTWLHRTPANWQFSRHGGPSWYFHAVRRRGATAVERHAAAGSAPDGARVLAPPWFSDARRPPVAAELAQQEQTQGDWMITEVAYGWPFPALSYEYEWHTHPVGFSGRLRWFRAIHGGILLARPAPTDASFAWRAAMHALPYRPVALGIALNTLFYGAALFAVYGGVVWLRRRSRHRRGLCAWCGYDLKGHEDPHARCPECGRINHRRTPARAVTPAP